MNVKIVRGSLCEYGENGWTWETIDDENRKRTYRTNNDGDGLWQCGSHSGIYAHNHDDQQIKGTLQFHLPKSKPAARRIIKRYFEE